jgi:nucleoside-diphosphate-sugar epimerase
VNIGSDELVTIGDLVTMVESIAGVELTRSYDLSAPQGVRGRNSDNELVQRLLSWSPSTRLEDGMRTTYEWVRDEMALGAV